MKILGKNQSEVLPYLYYSFLSNKKSENLPIKISVKEISENLDIGYCNTYMAVKGICDSQDNPFVLSDFVD